MWPPKLGSTKAPEMPLKSFGFHSATMPNGSAWGPINKANIGVDVSCKFTADKCKPLWWQCQRLPWCNVSGAQNGAPALTATQESSVAVIGLPSA